MLSVFVVAIVVKNILVYQWVLMGLGGGWGEGEGRYKSHFPAYFWSKSQSHKKSSNEEKGVKYAIFGGGTALKGQWGGGRGMPGPRTVYYKGPFPIPHRDAPDR